MFSGAFPLVCCFFDEYELTMLDRLFFDVDKFIEEFVMSGCVGVQGHSFGNKPDLLSIYCLRFFKQLVLPIGVETKDEPRSVYCFLRLGLAGVNSSPPPVFTSSFADAVW